MCKFCDVVNSVYLPGNVYYVGSKLLLAEFPTLYNIGTILGVHLTKHYSKSLATASYKAQVLSGMTAAIKAIDPTAAKVYIHWMGEGGNHLHFWMYYTINP